MINPVRKTTKFVMRHAMHVTTDNDAIKKVADRWKRSGVRIPQWPRELHFAHRNPRKTLDYLILLDSMNFCFWAKDPRRKWRITYHGKEWSGYFALAMAFKRFFDEKEEKATLEYFSKITLREFKEIFLGKGELLFLKKRWHILRSVSSVLVKRYGGDSRVLVRRAHQDAAKLVRIIVKELPSFDDTTRIRGKNIFFWKRAQLLVNDIWGAFEGRNAGKFYNRGYLTAFADYKLPQILRFWGVFKYDKALERKIKSRVLIPAGSVEEAEIRSATVAAVEYLHKALLKRGIRLLPCDIDGILWNESKRIKMDTPHHLTKTFFY